MSKQPMGRARTAIETAPELRAPRLRRRRRWPAYVIGVLALLVVLWLGYWYGATRVAEAAINRATSSPIGGLRVGCPDRSLSGFPLRIDVRCQRATVSDGRNGGLAAALGGFWASAPLYRPGLVDATLDGPLMLDMPERGLAVTASWSGATANASAWLDGLTGGGAHFDGLAVENGGRADSLPVRSLDARTADVSLTPAGNGDYRVRADAENVNLKLGDGTAIPELDVRGNVVAVGVGGLGTDPVAALMKWAKGGASTKIENLRLVVGGTIVTLSGQLSLSKDGLLNGSVLFAYNGIDALGNLLELFRPGSKAKYAEPLKIVNSLTRSVDTPDGQLRQTSITFTDGQIWLAIFPLIGVDPIPPIRF